MYGVCEAWRGVLQSPAPAAYCGQVNRRHQLGTITAIHTHSHSVVSSNVHPANLTDYTSWSLLPSCSTHMKTSQPSVCDLSWGEGEALVSAQEFPLCCLPFLLFLSSSALICTRLL